MSELVTLPKRNCAILSLVLKGKWYDMIASGEKREEYRAPTLYWRKRFHRWDKKVSADVCPVVEFRRGYAKDAPRMAFWCLGCETASGMLGYAYIDETVAKTRHPDWGEPEGPHLMIELGGRVTIEREGGRT